jgi:hypothetical protein
MGLKEKITFAHASPFPSRYLQTGGWGKPPHQFANSIIELDVRALEELDSKHL